MVTSDTVNHTSLTRTDHSATWTCKSPKRAYESQNNYVMLPVNPKCHLCIPRTEFRSTFKKMHWWKSTTANTNKQIKNIRLYPNNWWFVICLEEEKEDDLFRSVTFNITDVHFISNIHSSRLVIKGVNRNNPRNQSSRAWEGS